MNFLAHIFLSGDEKDIMIGNFIADSIKGKKYLNYPDRIQKGIILHRAIDVFTDTHPLVRQGASRLFPKYRHYGGVIVDIFYDHFLASQWNMYSTIPLDIFIADFYTLLQNNFKMLPPPVQNFLPFMIAENWLLSYSTLNGIENILYQMNNRTGNKSRMDKAVIDLEEHYSSFENEFKQFFPEMIHFAQQKILNLT